jgi:alpha-amylase
MSWICYPRRAGGNYDMRQLLEGTLMQRREREAVTFVENHDSQPLQSLESVVEPWFKPLAYATILLRRQGYPCLFYADYYGAEYEDVGHDGNRYRISMPSHRFLIDKFLHARRHYGFPSAPTRTAGENSAATAGRFRCGSRNDGRLRGAGRQLKLSRGQV